MGRLDIRVSNEVEIMFRIRATKKFGDGEGALSRALEEAINAWLQPDFSSIGRAIRLLNSREPRLPKDFQHGQVPNEHPKEERTDLMQTTEEDAIRSFLPRARRRREVGRRIGKVKGAKMYD